LEVVLVDDGSTDETLEIAKSFKDRLPLVIHASNPLGNWAANSNRGVELSNGKYINFLHQDDFWLPGRLACLRKAIEDDPEADVFFHPSRYVGENGKSIGRISCPLPSKGRQDSLKLVERLLVQNFIMVPAPLINRDIFLKAGCFDESLWYTPDWKLWLELGKLGQWYYLPEYLACFRLHPAAQTVKASHCSKDFRAQHVEVLEYFVNGDKSIKTQAIARCSIELNVALASFFHRQPIEWRQLFHSMKKLRPKSAVELLRYSRLHERVGARVFCGLLPPNKGRQPELPR
jgi:glycosyltransferase involved in cell wall biosynthesis